jgi:hypothetical protein
MAPPEIYRGGGVLFTFRNRTSIGVWRIALTGLDRGNNLYSSDISSGAGCQAKLRGDQSHHLRAEDLYFSALGS